MCLKFEITVKNALPDPLDWLILPREKLALAAGRNEDFIVVIRRQRHLTAVRLIHSQQIAAARCEVGGPPVQRVGQIGRASCRERV